jgi:hypothetical protein
MDIRYVIAVCLASACGEAHGSTVLDSYVTTNGNLYTYNYVLDNTGSTSISELDIRISPDIIHAPLPTFSAPSGWSMGETVAGFVANPPYSEAGSFFEFTTTSNDILPGSIEDFSFTVSLAPSSITVNGVPQNNYFVDGPGGITAYGVALAPNFGTTPIPPTLPLFASGLAALCVLGWWTRKSKQVGAA